MDIVEYKCPSCGADLQFSPKTQNLECEYCGSSFTVEEIKNIYSKQEESAKTETAQEESFEEDTKLYSCSSCGAEIMADSNQTALFCYYCHNPVILSGKLSGKYRPQQVMAFKIGREEALKTFKSWCFKTFVPKDFKSEQQLEKITGLYVPFWLADCTVKGTFNAIGKKTRSYTSGNYQCTETKEYKVIRKADFFAKGVPADGSERIDDDLMEAIEPFDYSELKDFSMTYLSGFFAEKYDVDKESIFPRIKARITKSCESFMKHSVGGYTSFAQKSEGYDFAETNWRYILLPVWFMSYKYKGKIYEFVLNGQSGKIAGELPIRKSLVRLCAASLFAGIAAITYIMGGLFLGGIF